jgi:uncharacterized protein YjdB
VNITNQVTWSSSAPQVATINSSGVATATGFNPTTGIAWVGNTTISASMPGFGGDIVSNNVTFTVTACTICTNSSTEPVTGLSITPSTDSVALPGQTGQFIALGISGTTGLPTNLSTLVAWSSSNAGVATICTAGSPLPCTSATDGLATAVGPGTTQITALYTNPDKSVVEATATFTVTGSTSEPLQSIAITPATQSILAGQNSQLIAIGTFSPTSSTPGTQNLTNPVVWASSNTSVASICTAVAGVNPVIPISCPSTPGLVTGVGPGTAVITAIATNPDKSVVTATATVTVTGGSSSSEPLVSLAVLPASQTSLTTGASANVNFIAIGTTGSGGTVLLTNAVQTVNGQTIDPVSWTSSNPAVASIVKATGVATPLSGGTTAITAIATNPDGTVVTGSAAYSVTVPTVTEPYVSLAIVPASQTVTSANQMAQYIAIGTTGTGATVDLTSKATWGSSSIAIAKPGALAGQFTAGVNGVAAITAEVPNPGIGGNPPDGTSVTASGALTVNISATQEPLLSMTLLPDSQSAPAGQATQFLAMGDFSSSTPGPGAGTRQLPVSSAVAGNVYNYAVTWYSSNPAVAVVCNSAASGIPNSSSCTTPAIPGQVIGLSAGTTALTAIASGNPDGSVVTAMATFTVTGPNPGAITGITINPASQTITMPVIGQPNPTVNLVVIGTNAAGFQSAVTPQVWTSSNPAVLPPANISSTGNTAVATITGPGTTILTATYTNTTANGGGIVTATATLTATGPAAEPLLSLAINPNSPSVPFPVQTEQLIAIGTFSAAPVTQNLTSTVTWSSSNKLIATVCNAVATTTVPISCAGATPGLVTGVSQGTVAITATTTNTDGTLVYATVPFAVTGGSAEQMTALTIVPASLSLSATGQAGNLIALGTSGSTGLQEDVTQNPTQIAWTSSNPTIATVSSAPNTGAGPTQTCTFNNATPPVFQCVTDLPGVVKGVSAGSSTITAEWTNPATGGAPSSVVTATASVDVTSTPAAEPLLSINILPTDATTDNLFGTAQYLAYGIFSTDPTELDITNGFYHAGFASAQYPSSSCTAAYAAADEAALAMTNPLTNPPDPQCAFVPVTWVSDFPFIFPVDSAGAAGATGGLVTADGSGTGDIYAVAANPDGTLVYSSISTFNCPYVAPTYATIVTYVNGLPVTSYDFSDVLNIGSCNYLTIAPELVSTVTVYGTGLNTSNLPSNWLVTAPSATGTPDVIHCGGSTEQAAPGGSVCTATYPNLTNGVPTTVTLTAPTEPGVNFGGWSDTCTTVSPSPSTAAGPNTCTVTLGSGTSSNIAVVAIFN